MGKRGPKPPGGTDPRQWVTDLRRGRNEFKREMVPTLLAWLRVMARRYEQEAAAVTRRRGEVLTACQAAYQQRQARMAVACGELAGLVQRPWGRIEWLSAVAELGQAGLFDPPVPSDEPDDEPADTIPLPKVSRGTEPSSPRRGDKVGMGTPRQRPKPAGR